MIRKLQVKTIGWKYGLPDIQGSRASTVVGLCSFNTAIIKENITINNDNKI